MPLVRYPDRLGHDHLHDVLCLAALRLVESGPDPILRLSLSGDRAATVDHGVELGEAMIRLGLCCQFRDHPIKFVTTTATGIPLVYDMHQLSSSLWRWLFQ